MGDLKATPGPWIVATSCSWRRIVSESGDPVCIPTIQLYDNHADMEFPNGGPEGPDASLMIAAHDLYEALSSIENDDGAIPSHIWDMRNAALAKARGENP